MENQAVTIQAPLSIELEDGAAHFMGEGVVVVMQRDATVKRRKMQNVVLSRQDLEFMQTPSLSLTINLEDGQAFHMGEGSFVVMQRDPASRGAPMQNVALSANDTAAILALAA